MVRPWLTKMYLEYLRGSFVRCENFEVEGVQERVFWFSDDSNFAGQTTLFNTIALNEEKLGDYSGNVRDYVFLHEYGHKLVPFPLRLLYFVLLFACAPAFIFAATGVVGIFLGALVRSGSIQFAVIYSLPTLIAACFFGFVTFVVFRVDEMWAENFALSRLGEERFLSSHEERERSQGSRFMRLYSWFVYPKPETVVRVRNWYLNLRS